MAWCVRRLILASLWIGAAVPLIPAEIPKAPVPKSPYVAIVYRYADTMLKNGRDTNGLFWSALDRNRLAPLTNRPAAPEGVREPDRVGAKDGPLAGSNPYHDENLLRLLLMLTDLSAKPHYRAAADTELKWLLEHGALRASESFRPWMLWDRCFELLPDASPKILLGLAQERIAPDTAQREAGFRIRALAVGYARTKDEQFTRAIAGWLDRHETSGSRDGTPSFAIDCEGAAHRVPDPLASRLRAAAQQTDARFTAQPKALLWRGGDGAPTVAQIGMMCVSRYDNSGDGRYRNLIFSAADPYLNSLPNDEEDIWPMTFGHAISLQLAAWRHSADWKYMERARKFGDLAVEKFWGTNALPKASFKTEHYETITGADTLALALVELHLNVLHITAVRCPPNTIDR